MESERKEGRKGGMEEGIIKKKEATERVKIGIKKTTG